MAPKLQDLKGIIVGTLKITASTDKKDRDKCRIWQAECVCGATELGSRSQLERYAGHVKCPGHPLKGKEKPLDGFKILPELRDTPKQNAALAAWETARTGKAPEKPVVETAKSTKERKASNSTGSEVLTKRLGLHGYRLETVHLPNPITVQGLQIYKAVFAKSITNDDRVFLHVAGRKSIISSRKKVSDSEWSALCAAFAELKLKWREKEPQKKAA
jgi:hypothetical protein